MTARLASLVLGVVATAAITATARHQDVPPYVWNLTPSVPRGLYAIEPPRCLRVTTLVVVRPPPPLASLLDQGGYLPRGVPLLKRIFALSGQTVCRIGTQISVDGIAAARARERDGRGRPLPSWQGCRVIGNDEVFLMNWDQPDSFDGRYFGPLPKAAVVARAIPLWTDEAGDGRLVWRAAARRSLSCQSSTTEKIMAHIGIFKRKNDGYKGTIRTLTLDREIDIIPAVASDAENAPNYRVLTGDVEIGAGWKRTGERAGDYVALVIDDPSFAHPIRANLFHLERDSDIFHLSWTRPSRRQM